MNTIKGIISEIPRFILYEFWKKKREKMEEVTNTQRNKGRKFLKQKKSKNP